MELHNPNLLGLRAYCKDNFLSPHRFLRKEGSRDQCIYDKPFVYVVIHGISNWTPVVNSSILEIPNIQGYSKHSRIFRIF